MLGTALQNFSCKLTTDEGMVITKHEEKEQNIFNFYSSLLGECLDREAMVNLEELNLPRIDLADLEVPFTEEEVWKTIQSLPTDKAPGPDGFTGKFYKTCWPIIKPEIMAAVSAVWSRKLCNFELLNSAYITLLPKKEDAASIRDFRPISLVHSFAKLITKLLANRLLVDWTSWSHQIRVLLLKIDLYLTISCWFNIQLNFCINKKRHAFY